MFVARYRSHAFITVSHPQTLISNNEITTLNDREILLCIDESRQACKWQFGSPWWE